MQSEKTELLKYEFDIETKRAQSYFDLMYRILNFSFAALTALIALTGALFNMKENTEQLKIMAFSYFTTENATEVEYVAGIRLTITADTYLYSVWQEK